MSEQRIHPATRLFPSLTDVVFVTCIIFLFTAMNGVRTMLGDGDTGWHIRAGEWMLQHGQVIRTDSFSFTKEGQPWFAWEWLWDIGAAALHARWGLMGVVLPSIFLVALTFALLYRLANRVSGHPLIAAGMTLLAAAGSTVHWLARPHLFTLLFTVIFLDILERVRAGNKRLLVLLPVLIVPWTNLHAGFLAGILILLAGASGEIVTGLLDSQVEARKRAFRSAAMFAATSAACLAASLVNPYFYQLHMHLWEYLRDPYTIANIDEFQSMNFHYGNALFFEAMLAAAAGAAVWAIREKRFSDLFLLAGLGHMALFSARNVPLFMIASVPVASLALARVLKEAKTWDVAPWLQNLCESFREMGQEIQVMEGFGRVHLPCVLALGLVALGSSSPAAGLKLKPEYDAKFYPEAALKMLDPSMRVFTHDEWGDYLIYKLSPQGSKVFVDGRSDFYGTKFCQEYIDVMKVKYDWQQTLSRYNIDTVLLPTDAPLASTIKESSHWRVVYDDGLAIVFRSVPAAGRPHTISASQSGGTPEDSSSGVNAASQTAFISNKER